jgi:hypothetical protein
MATSQPWLSNRHLPNRLKVLLGTWRIEGMFVGAGAPPTPIAGTTTIRWLVKDALVLMRTRLGAPAPASVSVLGADDKNNRYQMLYSDTRGVVRHYAMTLTARRWTLFRKAPGFWQRFNGRISADGRTIRSTWDASPDGRRWTRDLNLVYTMRR